MPEPQERFTNQLPVFDVPLHSPERAPSGHKTNGDKIPATQPPDCGTQNKLQSYELTNYK